MDYINCKSRFIYYASLMELRATDIAFIGIGAAKAGTTWLAQCLSEHPQIQ